MFVWERRAGRRRRKCVPCVPVAICPKFGRELHSLLARAAVSIDWALSRLLCFDHLTHEWFTLMDDPLGTTCLEFPIWTVYFFFN